mmetsp:Transcript_37636/g.90754  ORF Transcript_37636/g.90754 Transcript_37636/m.90754 type:complete len:223 (-) Transcript_37636:545-1213(-)
MPYCISRNRRPPQHIKMILDASVSLLGREISRDRERSEAKLIVRPFHAIIQAVLRLRPVEVHIQQRLERGVELRVHCVQTESGDARARHEHRCLRQRPAGLIRDGCSVIREHYTRLGYDAIRYRSGLRKYAAAYGIVGQDIVEWRHAIQKFRFDHILQRFVRESAVPTLHAAEVDAQEFGQQSTFHFVPAILIMRERSQDERPDVVVHGDYQIVLIQVRQIK